MFDILINMIFLKRIQGLITEEVFCWCPRQALSCLTRSSQPTPISSWPQDLDQLLHWKLSIQRMFFHSQGFSPEPLHSSWLSTIGSASICLGVAALFSPQVLSVATF